MRYSNLALESAVFALLAGNKQHGAKQGLLVRWHMPPIFTRNQEVKGHFRAHYPARLEVGLREALQNRRIDGTRVEPRSWICRD